MVAEEHGRMTVEVPEPEVVTRLREALARWDESPPISWTTYRAGHVIEAARAIVTTIDAERARAVQLVQRQVIEDRLAAIASWPPKQEHVRGQVSDQEADAITCNQSRPLVADLASAIWQTYVIELGRSLPPGLADKLAEACMAELER